MVCGVNGAAVGGGMSLALAGDLRVGCREKARFMPTFVKLGLGGAGKAGYPWQGSATLRSCSCWFSSVGEVLVLWYIQAVFWGVNRG